MTASTSTAGSPYCHRSETNCNGSSAAWVGSASANAMEAIQASQPTTPEPVAVSVGICHGGQASELDFGIADGAAKPPRGIRFCSSDPLKERDDLTLRDRRNLRLLRCAHRLSPRSPVSPTAATRIRLKPPG